MEELALYLRGWRTYFGFCETPLVLISLTRWVRLRLRAAMWRQWKTPRRRRAALLALGFVRDWPAIPPAAAVVLGRHGELDVVDSRDRAVTHENLVANGAKPCLPGFDKLSFFEPLVTLLRRDPSYW